MSSNFWKSQIRQDCRFWRRGTSWVSENNQDNEVGVVFARTAEERVWKHYGMGSFILHLSVQVGQVSLQFL